MAAAIGIIGVLIGAWLFALGVAAGQWYWFVAGVVLLVLCLMIGMRGHGGEAPYELERHDH